MCSCHFMSFLLKPFLWSLTFESALSQLGFLDGFFGPLSSAQETGSQARPVHFGVLQDLFWLGCEIDAAIDPNHLAGCKAFYGTVAAAAPNTSMCVFFQCRSFLSASLLVASLPVSCRSALWHLEPVLCFDPAPKWRSVFRPSRVQDSCACAQGVA